jgi:protein arginine N-methyltransferase 7
MHDTDRNSKYYRAIKWVPMDFVFIFFKNIIPNHRCHLLLSCRESVEKYIAVHGKPPLVLDIGSGTGLLSMMAARSGANPVVGCEVFKHLAAIASTITALNTPDVVTIVPKMSTHLVIGTELSSPTELSECDLPRKADILVTEIFDTILLGEGILPFLRQARRDLLQPNAEIVPKRACIYAQVVQHQGLRHYADLSEMQWAQGLLPQRNAAATDCRGGRVALPIHIAEIKPTPVYLTDPIRVLDFDFTVPSIERAVSSRTCIEKAIASGKADAVLFWWDLYLSDDIVYSTAVGAENWQDHWVQAVYPLPEPVMLSCGEAVHLTAHHSDTAVWFTLGEKSMSSAEFVAKRVKEEDAVGSGPEDSCICGYHTLCNPDRLLQLNDASRSVRYGQYLSMLLDKVPFERRAQSKWLDVSDGSFCGLIAATLHPSISVTSLEAKPLSLLLSQQICDANAALLGDRVTVVDELDDDDEPLFDVLVAEPFWFQMQNLCLWQALNFWYVRTSLSARLVPNPVVFPSSARIQAVAVQFQNLHISYGKCGFVEGFDHAALVRIFNCGFILTVSGRGPAELERQDAVVSAVDVSPR